ncbi:MAG TPA: Ig-like domain-containing protein [Candidatus Acidoferrum sp.]|nr:Ig-like domain-containing protein [Candidatus Acidoferrum sp.]
MKSTKLSVPLSNLLAVLGFLAVAYPGLAQHPPYVYIWSPTNGATYLAPANLTIYVRAVGNTNPVQTVQFFAGDTSLGTVTNLPGVIVTNVEPLYPFAWSNVLAGNYALKAVATDMAGLSATSAVVNISVLTNPPPPPPVRPVVALYYPTNNATFLAPANLTLYARAMEPTGIVQTVQFFAGTTSLGVVSNSSQVVVTNVSRESLFPLGWSNVLAGKYALTAVATDAKGVTATSSVVNISVISNTPPPNLPLTVGFYYPTNGQTFTALANIGVHAWVLDSNIVRTVQYFAGTNSIGIVSNTAGVLLTNTLMPNPFFLLWSNVPAGPYALTAVAADSAGNLATSAPVNISVLSPPPPPPILPYVYIYSPSNGAVYAAPANLTLYARAAEPTGIVESVQFFAGTNSLGVVSNSSQVVVTNISSEPLFPLAWSNVLAGKYELRAVATDAKGLTATSPVVNISVVSNVPPPNLPFQVGFYYPTNGQRFDAPANIGLHAWVVDSNIVRTVQYFAGTNSIGIVSNTAGVLLTNTLMPNPFFLLWSNVPAGLYALTAVATDALGLNATSPVVNITVFSPPPPSNRPPEVRIISPPNAAAFRYPVNVPIYAYAHDADGYVASVEFFAGTNSLGLGSLLSFPTNPPPSSYYSNIFWLTWSNPPVGSYALTAKATDNSNAVAVSAAVNITVLPPSPPPPVSHYSTVSIVASDPVAIEGTNCWVWASPTNPAAAWTNWPGAPRMLVTNCGPKNATFTVRRAGDTNSAVLVTYAIDGTASNGVDYVALPGSVVIPAGQHEAMISIVPIDDGAPDITSTVILKLMPSTNKPPLYALGSPLSAEAVIFDSATPSPRTGPLADRTFHINAAGPNGAWFHVEYSTNMVSWQPVCTNQVVNGWIDFIDPNASSAGARFYRAVPESNPPQ